MIRLSRPGYTAVDLEAASRVLASGMLVQGAEVGRFETKLAAIAGREHAVAVTNGTAALELALRVVGVGAGDEVLVPGLTWPSPAHVIPLLGAVPVLVDVDFAEWNATAEAFAAARTAKTKAAIVIDQFGMPARHAAIAAALPGLRIVEDAACGIGSTYQGRAVGSFGDVSCMSFHPRKVITTGEGGACLTNDGNLANRLRILRNHGQSAPGVFEEPSGNHRLTEMGAALGASQLDRLEPIVASRRAQAKRYHAELPELMYQRAPEGAVSNWQTVGALLPNGWDPARRLKLIEEARAHEVEIGALSYALNRIGSMKPFVRGPLPNAEQIVDRGIALPAHVELTESEQSKVIEVVRTVINKLRP